MAKRLSTRMPKGMQLQRQGQRTKAPLATKDKLPSNADIWAPAHKTPVPDVAKGKRK
jgi:hypothetical protein